MSGSHPTLCHSDIRGLPQAEPHDRAASGESTAGRPPGRPSRPAQDGCPSLRRRSAAPTRRARVLCHADSPSTPRMWLFPVFVMPPRRVVSPELCLLGTSPTYAASSPALPNRDTSPSSASTVIAVTVSTPRKHRSRPTPIAVVLAVRHLREPRLEQAHPLLRQLQRVQVAVEGRLRRRVLEGERAQPAPVAECPGRLAVAKALPQQELRQPLLRALAARDRVLARPREVAHRLLGLRRLVDLGEQVRPQQLCQVPASRRSVLTRSPGLRGISAGAITRQSRPFAWSWRWAKPVGPAS